MSDQWDQTKAAHKAWRAMTPAERRAAWEDRVNAGPRPAWVATDVGRMAITVNPHVLHLDDMLAVRGEVFVDADGGKVIRAMVGVQDGPPDSYFAAAAKALAILLNAGHVHPEREG